MALARLGSMFKRLPVLPALVLSVIATGCGGSGSPVAPEPSGAGGASITGSILSGGSSAMTGSSSGRTLDALVVTVAGTSIKSSLDATGRFRLDGVPSGDLQLQFTGPVTATIPVPQVQPTETITLVLSLSTTTVILESQQRSGAGDEQVEGRVESLPPTMAAGSLQVAGRTVSTDASTIIRRGGSTAGFSDLEIGFRVHVKGRTSGSNIVASSIDIQNVNTTIPVNVNGVIDTVSGSAAGFQFNIGSRIVKGDTSTIFFGDGSAARTFADLTNGDRVEVKGLQRDGYVYAERIHINGPDDEDDDDDEQDSSASIHGRVNALSGASPSLMLTVDTTIVRTTSETEVKRRGDVQTLAAIALGQEVHVIGTRQPDGSLIARRIELNDDAPGGAVEIAGSAGGVAGTCQAITFKINGYSIQTSTATVFENITCAAIKSGSKLTVKGTSGPSGVILATHVKG